MGDTHTFNKEESAHIVKVLRLKVGDKLNITDGKGTLFNAQISVAEPKKCKVSILGNQKSMRPSPSLHIAIAPTKSSSRLETFVEKAVELGIHSITLIDCTHSERSKLNTKRLHKLAISAMKQSLQTWLPAIHEMIPFEDILKQESSSRLIAHCMAHLDRKLLSEVIVIGNDTLLLIGPEGDFSPDEVKLALEKGFDAVTLSPNRLRTETAALLSCATFNLINQ